MKRWQCVWAMIGALGFSTTGVLGATNEANVRLYLHSVRVEKGQASELSLDYFLEFSSYGNWANPNAEFYDLDHLGTDAPTHFSEFLLTGDVIQGLPDPGGLEGYLWLTVPEDVDADLDGVADCYEVGQGIQEVTSGGGFVLWGVGGEVADEGPVTARWQRAAGQARGQCFLELAGTDILTDRLEFRHDFEVIEYAGTLRYQPSTGLIQGAVDLVQVGTAQRRLQGPLVLQRASDFPLDYVGFAETTWTNGLGQALAVATGELARDMAFELEYFAGPLAFDDGDPSTPGEPDYELFYLGIDDPNDADGDGVPDLTDPPTASGPRLALSLVGGSVPQLAVTGTPGTTYRVEGTGSLAAPGWTNVTSFVLTNATQTVPLGIPSGTPAFWRVVTP